MSDKKTMKFLMAAVNIMEDQKNGTTKSFICPICFNEAYAHLGTQDGALTAECPNCRARVQDR